MDLAANANNLIEGDNESQKQLRILFNSMPQLGWTAKADGFIDFYNQGWYDYTGTSYEEMQGWGWEKVHDPEYLPQVIERWKHSLEHSLPFDMKFPLRRHDGIFRWFLTRVTPLLDEQGKCLRWIGINTDIQDELDRSNAFAQREKQFRILADSLPDLVWVVDGKFKVQYLNQRWSDYTGISIKDGLGDGWRRSVLPDDLITAEKEWGECLAAKKPYEGEQRILGADGKYRWFSVRGVPVFDEQNHATSWFGTCRDIQYKKEASEALERIVDERTEEVAQAKALNETVVDSISDALVIADPNGNLNYVNEAARAMFDNEPLPKTLADAAGMKRYYTADGSTALDTEDLALSKALKGDSVHDSEMIIKRSTGASQSVSVAAKPIRGRTGAIIGAVAAIRDINARKAVELAIQQARDEAISANKVKTQFVANISHEIRTPMSGILGLSELLSLETEGQTKETADHILSSARNLMQLVDDLLDLSNVESGRLDIKTHAFRIDAIFSDVMNTFKTAAAKKHLKFSQKIDERILGNLVGDSHRISQVLHNLVHNAVKFTDGGAIQISARLESSEGKIGQVRFSVRDTGAGISLENQKRLFQLFVQVDGSTTRRHGGLGLGLSLSERMVEILGGQMGVESTEGRGSTFWFILPLHLDLSS